MEEPLTVGDLIECLKDFDPETPVHRLVRPAAYGPIEDVSTRRLATLSTGSASIVVDVEDPMWDGRQAEFGEPFEAIVL